MKDGPRQKGEGDGGRGQESLSGVVFDFEDTGEGLSLLPLAARRALDVAGFRLSLEGWQSLPPADRKELTLEGGRDAVDASLVEMLVKRSALPATRIRPVPDPDALLPPEQLSTFLGSRRAIDPGQWTRLRALDRYALIHVLRRSIAHDDPLRLETALDVILPQAKPERGGRGRARSYSPSPAPPPVGRARGGAADASGARERRHASDFPETDRRPPPVTSRSESSPAREAVRVRDGLRGVRALIESERPPRGAARSDLPPSYAASTARGVRDTLDSVEHSPRGGGRDLEELDDVADHDSEPPFDSGHDGFSSHLSDEGEVRMVDVGEKPATLRRATASGHVSMRRETLRRVEESDVPKGDVLSTARLAGIMAAKRTPELVPLCHHVRLTKVDVHVELDPREERVSVLAVVEARDRTGVEMEALAAVSAACLAVYDMLKGIDRDMVISDIKLLQKSGGRSGNYVRED
jgi:cyclic pyranopterin phosphate synthase